MLKSFLFVLFLPACVFAASMAFHRNNVSSWSPLYLNTALVGWFDASDSSTLYSDTAGTTRATSGAVALWKDKSGHGYNASQSTASARPTLTGQGLVFAGNSSSTTLLSTMTLSQFTTTNAGSIFTATKVATGAVSDSAIANFRVTGGNDTGLILSTSTTWGMDWLTSGLYGWKPANIATGVISVVGFVNNASTQLFSFNGTTATDTVSTSAVGTGQTTGMTIGQDSSGSRFYTGTIYEIVMTNSALSTSDRQKLEGYLAWKWGTQSLLPAGHPYLHYAP